jgi:16S rRNA (guanine966-N2)-methyltransferase
MAQAAARTRITAGEWRGRLVDTPRGGPVRPTTALVRKALFDILGARVPGARVVDLYAGTAAVPA